MDGTQNTNFPGEMPSAPPPPPEVKVRTMRSDLEMMAKSGGGPPHFQNVEVKGLAGTVAGTTGAEVVSGTPAPREESARGVVIAVVVVAAIAAVAFAGYLVYQTFFAGMGGAGALNGAGGPTAATTTQSAGSQSQTAPSISVTLAAPFMHASLFKQPADQTVALVLSLGGAATSASDLQTFNQKLSALLGGTSKTANLIEIAVQDADGHGVAISDLLAQMNAPILSAAALAHFNPDPTFFVYRDKNGAWPGIILSLKTGDNWLFAKSDVQSLELSAGIGNLFLQNAGTASAKGFTDSSASSTAVRMLAFPNANPPGFFLYGFYGTDLILSTSENGFLAAINRL